MKQHPNEGREWSSILILVVAAILVAIYGCDARADVRPGSFACDFANRPGAAKMVGAEQAILTTRGVLSPAADTLRSGGTKLVVMIQPTIAFVNGQAIGSRPGDAATYPWDTPLYQLALARDAVVKDSTGAWAEMYPGHPAWQAKVLDMRDGKFVEELAQLIVATFPRTSGRLWDYGCGDLAWMQLPGVDPGIWPAWREGYRRLLTRVRELAGGVNVCQCDKWPVGFDATCDGVLLEKAGWDLNPPRDAWADATRIPGRRVYLRHEDTWSQRRRLFAGMALVTGGLFSQSPVLPLPGGGHNFAPMKDPEHWELTLGEPGGSWWERSPRVYQRMFSRGLVIVNLSDAPLVYAVSAKRTYTIASLDALVAQTRDARGRYITWITTQGR